MKDLNQEIREKFLVYLKQRGLADRTRNEYIIYYDRLVLNFGTLTQENINNFLTMCNNGMARAFIKNFQKFICLNRREFEMTDSELLIIKEIELPDTSRRKKSVDVHYISYDMVKKINMKIPEIRYKLMFAINFFGGLRLSELLNIKYTDFDWDDWVKSERTSVLELKVLGKGSKYRIVFIPCNIAKALDSFCRNSGKQMKKIKDEHGQEKIIELPLFRLSKRNWQKKIAKYGKEYADISLHPHMLRHSFATYLLKRGWSLIKIKEYLGHEDISTTQIYAHVDIQDIKKDYEDLGF